MPDELRATKAPSRTEQTLEAMRESKPAVRYPEIVKLDLGRTNPPIWLQLQMQHFEFAVAHAQFECLKKLGEVSGEAWNADAKGDVAKEAFREKYTPTTISFLQDRTVEIETQTAMDARHAFKELDSARHLFIAHLTGVNVLLGKMFVMRLNAWMYRGAHMAGLDFSSEDMVAIPLVRWEGHRFRRWRERRHSLEADIFLVRTKMPLPRSDGAAGGDRLTTAKDEGERTILLTYEQQVALDVIKQRPNGSAITGPHLCREMEKLGIQIGESVLTSRIIPTLKKYHGVQNKPRVGYFVDPDSTAR